MGTEKGHNEAAGKAMNDLNVFIVTYNSAKTIKACLESLKGNLTGNPLVAVWDNNSCDGTEDVIKNEYPEVRLHRSKQNLGFGRGINELRNIYGGSKYIMVLNPDAELLEFDCHILLKKQNEMKDVAVWGAKIIDENNRIMPSTFAFSGVLKEIVKLMEINQHLPFKWKPVLSRWAGRFLGGSFSAYADSFNAHPNKFDWVSGAAMIIRGDLFANDYLFDPGYFLYYEDGDLCKRARMAGYDINQLSKFIIRHRVFGSSSYNSVFRLKAELESMVYYRKKWSSIVTQRIIALACLVKSLAILLGLSLIRHEDEIALSRSYIMASKALWNE
ncbi:MAG: glycosyltransferase family 2 protein [Desulfocucumaceae bacterium]